MWHDKINLLDDCSILKIALKCLDILKNVLISHFISFNR